uniref:Uncharacterized protein n=1 Tax=Manihot esculenta TaxID=3983 RepID=A0A2C9VN42_MANES
MTLVVLYNDRSIVVLSYCFFFLGLTFFFLGLVWGIVWPFSSLSLYLTCI